MAPPALTVVIFQTDITFLFMNRSQINKHVMLSGANRNGLVKTGCKSVKLCLRLACTNVLTYASAASSPWAHTVL